MTAKEILAKIKAVFDAPPVDAPTPAAATSTVSIYMVDGSGPVYVDNSDDGVADIDSGDKVYSDAALTTPYPDGTYNVTGTTFGFTVAGGVVAAVNDVAGTGPGAPADPTTLAAPAPVPAPAPSPAPPVTLSVEQIQATIAESLAPVQAALTNAATQMEAASKKIDEQNKIIARHEETIKGMFELVDVLTKEPTANPVTVPPNKKEKFDKAAKNEEKFEKYAKILRENKTEKATA